jgi:hypothetical protein
MVISKSLATDAYPRISAAKLQSSRSASFKMMSAMGNGYLVGSWGQSRVGASDRLAFSASVLA